jgi:hypothetical protein
MCATRRTQAAGRMPGVPDLEVHHPEDPRHRRILAAALDRLRRDSTLQRRVLLRTIGIAVLVATLATVILTAMALTSSASTADRLAAAGDVLVGATLLLAVIAALVALLAYAVSTGAPDLQLSAVFYPSAPRPTSNNPVFEAEIRDHGVLNAHSTGMVGLRNGSGYSAKNPVVIVRLHRMLFDPRDRASFEREWASMGIAEVSSSFAGFSGLGGGLTVVQWDGGSTYSIHGHSTRVHSRGAVN